MKSDQEKKRIKTLNIPDVLIKDLDDSKYSHHFSISYNQDHDININQLKEQSIDKKGPK